MWPESQRASADQFRSRIHRFPEGVLVALHGQRYVACSTSCLMAYCPERIQDLKAWDQVTNHGFFPARMPRGANAVYIASNGIVPDFRRTGLRERLVTRHLDLAWRLGMRYVVTGAMLPGYADYCLRHGDIPVERYAALQHNDEPVDPTLRKLARLGLELPSSDHLIAGYYPSPESRDYAALLVCDGNSPRSA